MALRHFKIKKYPILYQGQVANTQKRVQTQTKYFIYLFHFFEKFDRMVLVKKRHLISQEKQNEKFLNISTR